jgi:hypothetical protein
VPDLRELATDPAMFAAEARGGRLIDWQENDLRAGPVMAITCWTWGRQMGKSERLADLGLWAAFRAPEQRVLIVSGGGELGSRRLLDLARRVASRSPLLRGSVADDGASVLRLSNGSELRCVPASEHAVRGWTADALLVDESQLVSDDLLLGAALPTVAARPAAFVVLAGTASRAEGAFYDLCRQGEMGAEGVGFSRRVSRVVGGEDQAPWQSATLMARLEAAMGPTRADAELRCIPASGGDYLLSRADVDRVTADYRTDELAGLVGPAGVSVGLDLGVAVDRSALIALGRPVLSRRVEPVFAVRCAHAWPAGHPLMSPAGGVFHDVAASPAVLEAVRVDATGMQAGFLEYLLPLLRRRPRHLGGGRKPPPVVLIEEDPYADDVGRRRRPLDRSLRPEPKVTDVRGVRFSQPMKMAAYGALRLLIQRGALLLPASAVELRRELLNLRVGLSRTGGETFEAGPGGHDDLADALVLALRPYRRPTDGAWRTVVGDWSDMPVPSVDVPPGLFASGAVSTGGGVELPAVPVWASMAAREVTVPAVVQDWTPPVDPRMAAIGRAVRDALETNKTEGAR